ncbi:GDSL lipase/acylhydrolase family protein [Rhizodiscina lignyota]|uniref:GDSL lipase/acylhydrolase family protein n=1 Tax=Rhizodiscina lignyota TaxID=1504668 RepID=A0A9P4I308_9PEZI|nr:GDSL lipase/acylhydrolase family protein [Rhizodiscina lignyota]
MVWPSLLVTLVGLLNIQRGSAYGVPNVPSHGGQPWGHIDFDSFVAFGDSYTDEQRLGYFISHNGSAPPPGTLLAASNSTSDGGYIWTRYVTFYASRPGHSVKLYNYAVSGAVCDNDLGSRFFASINGPFPDIKNYEMPAFYADVNFRYSNGTKALDIDPSSTVYAMWIGTNDLGTDEFLTDSQVPGKTLVDYLDCVYDMIDKIYANPINGRYLVLMNIAPLQLVPMYQLMNISGLDEGYQNATETHYRMWEQVALVNQAYEWRTMGEVMVKKRYPGMKIAVFDVNSLLTNIHDNPSQYLNGTAPANVTGYINHCNANGTDCMQQPSPDSYEWFDALHPSQQTDRIIAQEFLRVVEGKSNYAWYFS